jgi:MFS family permease
MQTMDRKKTRRTVTFLALASFLNDLGSDMIYPIWPMFITTGLGASMSVLGLLDGLGDAIVSISQAASGYLSDRIRKRKVFVWLGYLLGSGARVGYALSVTWQHVLPFRVLDRTGKMRGAPRDAMIADVSSRANRGTHFGLLRAMDNLGAVCGILACMLLFGFLGYRSLFLLAAIPSAVGAILVVLFIKERKPAEERIYKGISFSDLDLNFRLFLFLSAVFSFGSFSYSFLLMYAHELGFRLGFLPVLYLVFTAVASLVSLPFGRLADRIGRRSVLLTSFLFWGLACACLLLVRSREGVVVAFVLYGLHKGAIEPVQKAFVSELAPRVYRASSLGGFQLVVGLCALPSSLLAGLLWDEVGAFVPLYVSIGLTAIASVLLIFVKERRTVDRTNDFKPNRPKGKERTP